MANIHASVNASIKTPIGKVQADQTRGRVRDICDGIKTPIGKVQEDNRSVGLLVL